MSDALTQAAQKLGFEHGKKHADVPPINMLLPTPAKKIIDGYDSQDKAVLDLCPKPFDEESTATADIIEEIAELAEANDLLNAGNIEEAMYRAGSVLDSYEEAFKAGFWSHVIEVCERITK